MKLLYSLLEAALKPHPTVTEAEIKELMSAQLKYTPGRENDWLGNTYLTLYSQRQKSPD